MTAGVSIEWFLIVPASIRLSTCKYNRIIIEAIQTNDYECVEALPIG